MKKWIAVVVLLCAGLAVYAQTKPRLGILPFTGGSGTDGDTIARLFSGSSDLMSAFRIVQRTSSIEAVMREQAFQRSGITDSDTIADLGKQMNADYVVSGHIARLGNANLLLISIVDVNTMRQITGDYREYQNIEGIPALLPAMARNIISSIQDQGVASTDTLAVLPLVISDPAVQQDEAELLAQILATEIANSHKYAVFPRTRTIETVMTERDIQRSGMTDRESMAAIGKATNARYVLAGSISKLGSMNLFNIAILEIESAEQIAAAYKEYRNLEDGIEIMGELSYGLTAVVAGRYRENVELAEAERQREEAERRQAEDEQRRLEAERQQARQKERLNTSFHNYLWGDGKSLAAISGNLGVSAVGQPGLFLNVGVDIPIIRYLFIEGGMDFGLASLISEVKSDEYNNERGSVDGYKSLYVYARLNAFLPLSSWGASGGLYAGIGIGSMTETYNLVGTVVTETKDDRWGVPVRDYKYDVKTEEKYKSSAFDIVAGYFVGSEQHLCRIGLTASFLNPDKDLYLSSDGGYNDKEKNLFSMRITLGYTYRFK
jgi:TolB-like protein